jgi:hypothetical protein
MLYRNRINYLKVLLIGLGILLASFISYIAAGFAVRHWYATQYSVAQAESKQTRVLLAWARGTGEQETILRLQVAAQRLGVDLRVVTIHPRYYLRWFIKDPVNTAIKNFQPDFILSIQDWVNYYPGLPNYMTLTLGTDRYIANDANGVAQILKPELLQFDALLPTFRDIDKLREIYERSGKKFNGFPWYPSAYITNYTPAEPKKLFYSGGFRWDTTRSSAKYTEVFKKLDQTGYLIVSGPKRKWRHTPNSAIGFVKADGKSLMHETHKAGVALLLHHKEHIAGGAPTSRIFEAAAANVAIISDRHPFIMQHFGDNVLYIDIDEDAEIMYQQIDQHMRWLQANPDKAKQMAENCHKINNELFSLEMQLQKLLDMHRSYVEASVKT